MKMHTDGSMACRQIATTSCNSRAFLTPKCPYIDFVRVDAEMNRIYQINSTCTFGKKGWSLDYQFDNAMTSCSRAMGLMKDGKEEGGGKCGWRTG